MVQFESHYLLSSVLDLIQDNQISPYCKEKSDVLVEQFKKNFVESKSQPYLLTTDYSKTSNPTLL